MVESEADSLPEDVMLGAVVFGHEQMQVAIKAINELKAEAGKPAWNWQPPPANAALEAALAAHARSRAGRGLPDHRQASSAATRIQAIKEAALQALAGGDAPQFDAGRRVARNSAISNTASCAVASSTASRASTAAT